MENESAELRILKEIRDLLKSREEKYDRYIKEASKMNEDYFSKCKESNFSILLWLTFAITIGFFIAGQFLGLGKLR